MKFFLFFSWSFLFSVIVYGGKMMIPSDFDYRETTSVVMIAASIIFAAIVAALPAMGALLNKEALK